MKTCANSTEFFLIFILRPVSAVRPSSVTDNLRGRHHAIWGNDMLLVATLLLDILLVTSGSMS